MHRRERVATVEFSDNEFCDNDEKISYFKHWKIKMISEEKKDVVKNLYLSGIGEEFIAMQLDLEIPIVISVLKELGTYRSEKKE
jgi:hypothetical protein